MKLASVQDVLDRMNLSNTLAGSPAAIASALESATVMVESILQTSLASSEQIDYFSVSYSSYNVPTTFMFWLKRGFVKTVSGVYASDDGSKLDSIVGLTAKDTGDYIVSEDIGRVTLLKYVPRGECNVAVRYTSGFADEDPTIPADIKDAAVSAAVYIINAQSVVHGKKDKDAHLDTRSRLHGMVHSAIKERIVTPFGGYYPYKSTQIT